jgi:succinate dehydrogenase/fumarate reductase flavoprotein subunit
MTKQTDLLVDVLVVGSGAGGLSTAVAAAHLGLKVLVVEKDPHYGGTTAWSGGWLWIPRNPLAVAAGIHETLTAPLLYLKQELGERFDETKARAFLEHGPRMVEFFKSRTALQFVDGNAVPDFHGNSLYAAMGGRSLCAAPFDAWRLEQLNDKFKGKFKALKAPLPETTLWGMGIASGADLRHFLSSTRSLASFWYVTKRVLALWRDLILFGRSTRLVNGNALVAGLAASAFEAGVELRVNSPVTRLLMDENQSNEGKKVLGAVIKTSSGEQTIKVRFGVVLACGGFPHDTLRKKELLPHAPTGHEHWSAASRGNTGDGLRLGEWAGGHIQQGFQEGAALAPVSLVPQKDGSFVHFPHLLERGKPGLIAVTKRGLRFTNEANSYYDFMRGLFAATPEGELPEAWLIVDHRFIRRYGLGAVKPFPMPFWSFLRNGYLKRGRTLAELAKACGIDANALEETVAGHNWQALQGRDTLFGRGDTPYNRVQGDNTQVKIKSKVEIEVKGKRVNSFVPEFANPCMAAIEHAPFYAVRVVAGSLGTFAGLETNEHAQVLDENKSPIEGLYAAGNDMASVMGGHYPSGGITLGPAMTFGYIAAHHMALQAISSMASTRTV